MRTNSYMLLEHAAKYLQGLAVVFMILLQMSCGATTDNSNTTVESVDVANGQTTQGYFPTTSDPVGITTDMCGTVACTEGATPGSSPTAAYDGFPDDITPPTITSIVVNGSYTLTNGGTNMPLHGSGSSNNSFVITFDKAMLTDQEAGESGSPVDQEDMTFTCTGDAPNQSRVSEASVTYSSSTTLAFSLSNSLPAETECTLSLNTAGAGAVGGTQRIRDSAHNPLAPTVYTVTSACGLNDDFTDGLGCWTVVNANNGTYSASSGILTLSIPGTVVSTVDGVSPTAAALQKSGVRVTQGWSFMRFQITIDSISGFQNSGDGVGLRVSDGNGNYAVLLVSNQSGTNRYRNIYGTNGSSTDTFIALDYVAGDSMYIQVNESTISFSQGGSNIGLAMDMNNLTVQIVGMKNNSGVASTVTMSNFTTTNAE